MYKLGLVLPLSILMLTIQAQSISSDVISALDLDRELSGLTLSSTLGEVVVSTHSNSLILTQGFHQIEEMKTVKTVEPQEILDLTIFPNPSDGIFNINSSVNRDLLMVSIYNHHNLLLNSFSLSHGEIIDLTPYPEGVYTVRISAKNRLPIVRNIIKIK